jgi:hypothetical protein
MEENKVLQQMQAVIRFFMALFYLGAGIFMLFFAKNFQVNSAVLKLVGGTFLLYGIYRIYKSVVSIYRLFFSKDSDNE